MARSFATSSRVSSNAWHVTLRAFSTAHQQQNGEKKKEKKRKSQGNKHSRGKNTKNDEKARRSGTHVGVGESGGLQGRVPLLLHHVDPGARS
eukprot:2461759-Rhodomonas_salina.2